MAKNTKQPQDTPLMQQYFRLKAQYPDAILLYRMGDFYETFAEDAIKASKILGITLTKRSHGSPGDVELAGFPYHAIDTYMPKLVRAGERVAICEQLEDPKKTKKLVKRGVIELVTPGVSYGEYVENAEANIFLAAVYFTRTMAAVSFLDLTTGEFLTTEGSTGAIDKLLNSFRPKEVIYPKGKLDEFNESFSGKFYLYPVEEWFFETEAAKDRLLKHFGVNSLKGFGINNMPYAVGTAGAALYYLEMTKHDAISHITSISRIDQSEHLLLDRPTLRNLEILSPVHEGGKSLSAILNRCITPMGSRNLNRWIGMPLKDPDKINRRLDIVETFVKDEELRCRLRDILCETGDMERLSSKIGACKISPRELNQMRRSLETVAPLREACLSTASLPLKDMMEETDPCSDLICKIKTTIAEEAPHSISKGNAIAPGVDKELDDLRYLAAHGKDRLHAIQEREIQATGINSLKIGFNNVFGYYIEVTRVHAEKVPVTWIRKQTLVNAERYITPELKEYEEKILGAEEKITEIENRIFRETVEYALPFIRQIQKNAGIIAAVDSLLSFAEVSVENGYNRPVIDASLTLEIKDGRHPVIEKELPVGEKYIPNSLKLDNAHQQIMIITGPNMAGKSALLRQTALIVIMAQAGCFVPAKSADIGFVDKIFTRVGASDNISRGESTFMVEMNEAANILNNISDRSLVLFDELGRGTSTYDGISIAWAIVEYIHENKKNRAKTLFATHYHELNEMEKSFPKIRNYNVSVKELEHKIIFLRKLIKGGTNHSFGIQVGKMAGLPLSVVKRAEDILKLLENDMDNKGCIQKNIDGIAAKRAGMQLSFFQLEDPVLCRIRDEIKDLDINSLTPIEALNKLHEIKKITGL